MPARSAAGTSSGRGSRSSTETDCPGLMPQVTVGAIIDASMWTTSSHLASGSEASVRHHAHARSKASPCGANRRPAQVLEGRVVGIDVAGARAALDRHVADRHALVHRHARDRVAGVLIREARPALDAEPADDRENDVLRVDARAQIAVDLDAAHLHRQHGERLRREHVAHLRGADAERQRAERAVRGRVAVAAGDRHARLREPQFGADDVDDALRAAAEVEERDAVRPAVALERRPSCSRPSGP